MNGLIRWKWRNTILVVMHGVLALVSMAALAQEPSDAGNSEPQGDASSDSQIDVPVETHRPIAIEQIIVTAERSYFTLNNQISLAKNRMYSEYNELNELDEFDVDCRNSDWTHTRISREGCWPVFFDEAVAQNAIDFLQGFDLFLSISQLELQNRKKFEELRANIAHVASENPSAGEALMELGRLEAALRKKKEECMEQPAVLFFFRLCR